MPGLQDDDDTEKIERLKSALWYAIGQTVDAISLEQDLNATPQFIGALTEMLWTQIQNAGRDAEAFAKHAGRSTITKQDILLLARRNESLDKILRQTAELGASTSR